MSERSPRVCLATWELIGVLRWKGAGTEAVRWLSVPCGVLAGIGGFTHGVGEVLQGSDPRPV